jgi:mono/diheme cytochrome c family protein
MKKLEIVCMVAIGLFLYTSLAVAEKPSVEMGKQLFNDPGLGASTTPTNCGSCHPNGEGMEKAGAKLGLAKMINGCIKGPLKGEPLSEESVAMESLMAYIRSLDKQ